MPIAQHIRTLNAARLAADVEGVPTVLLCRTDAQSARLLTSDIDERDHPFITGERTPEGFFRIRSSMGIDYAIARSLAYAPYVDLLGGGPANPTSRKPSVLPMQSTATSRPRCAYKCSPSFNWDKNLASEKIAGFQRDISAMDYKFQFVTLAGFHSLNTIPCSRSRATTGSVTWPPIQNCSRPNPPRKPLATRQPTTSARSA